MNIVNISTSQKVTLHADAKDDCGLKMDFGGTPSWSNTNDSIATISPAGDGLSCEVTAITTGYTDVTVSYNDKSSITRIQVGAPQLNVINLWNDPPVSQN